MKTHNKYLPDLYYQYSNKEESRMLIHRGQYHKRTHQTCSSRDEILSYEWSLVPKTCHKYYCYLLLSTNTPDTLVQILREITGGNRLLTMCIFVKTICCVNDNRFEHSVYLLSLSSVETWTSASLCLVGYSPSSQRSQWKPKISNNKCRSERQGLWRVKSSGVRQS